MINGRIFFAAAVTLIAMAAPVQAAKQNFKVMHVADLAKALESAAKPTIFDVNVESTRESVGIIPEARLLSSSSAYDVARELPVEKTARLVFYCANTLCTASHEAANKALAAGYSNVSVMVDGIYGWKKAGRPLSSLPSQPHALGPKQVAAMVKIDGAIIVDVREKEERHIVVPGARWLPMSRINDAADWNRFVAGIPQGKTVVFHCAVGGRAKRAAEMLHAQGYQSAYFQGPDQWKSEGLPVENGPHD